MLMEIQFNFPKLSPLEISQIPNAFEGYLTICFSEEDTVLQYLKSLKDTCEMYLQDSQPSLPREVDQDEHLHISSLLTHIEELGWEKVLQIAADFSFIDLLYRDERERSHTLRLKIPPTYPSQPPAVEVDFPLEVHFPETSERTLCALFEGWKRRIFILQHFWNVLDELDDSALVIDPVMPLRRHASRRILLENHIGVHLTVSPDRPFSSPKCHLLGPSSVVALLKDRLIELYQRWDASESIVFNLEAILKVSVVRRSREDGGGGGGGDGWDVECVVCYSLHLDGHLPDCTCDHCRKSFHIACLYDWLGSLPSSRQSGPFIMGDCPYCTKPISCKVPVP